MSQLIFGLFLMATIGAFAFTTWNYYRRFRLTKPAFPIKDIGKRLKLTLWVAFAQSKMFRKPLSGILHACLS